MTHIMETTPLLSSFSSQSIADAMAFLDHLQATAPHSCLDFSHIMEQHAHHKIDAPTLINKVSSLLRGREDLFGEFTRFLPPHHQFCLGNQNLGQQTISHVEKTIGFFNKLILRLGDDQVVDLLLDRIKFLGHNHRYTGRELGDLLGHYPDLFQELKALLAADDHTYDDDEEEEPAGCESGFPSAEFKKFLQIDNRFDGLDMLEDIESVFDLFEDRRFKLDMLEKNLDSIAMRVEAIWRPIQDSDWDNLVPADEYFTALNLSFIKKLYGNDRYLDAVAFLYENPEVGLSRLERRLKKAKEDTNKYRMKLNKDWQEFLNSHFLPM